MSETILKVENLVIRYGEIRAVKGISFELRRGEILALIGANGAGKTTTLRGLSGMLPYEGSVELEGRSLKGLSADRIVHLGMAHVPEGRGIFGGLTVMENLRLGAWVRRDAAARNRDLEWVLGVFPRLRERLDQLAGTLSGGEQQMLAIGRAIMSKPKLLLLDEPSLGLAPLVVEQIFQTIRDLTTQMRLTVVLVEQNAMGALKIADLGIVLNLGKVVAVDHAQALIQDPAVRAAYLGY